VSAISGHCLYFVICLPPFFSDNQDNLLFLGIRVALRPRQGEHERMERV
jgi:hypothetical protein